MTTESLNLNSLVSSLPSHSLNASSEKELLDNFKAAALSITTLYRSSRHASKRAYNAGYAAACRDLMEMLQQGVSESHTLVPDRNEEAGMTIGRVMDWVEARLDAVRCREEEEDEEDERERGSHSSAPNASAAQRPSAPARKPSPSPPPSRVTAGASSPPRSSIPLKPTRTSPHLKPTPSSTALSAPIPPTDFHVPISFPFLENVPPPVTGSKRRHAVMMMPPPISSAQSTPSSSSSPVPTQRRRTRSTRGLFPHNNSQVMDGMMDVEEDGGRERKRVARR